MKIAKAFSIAIILLLLMPAAASAQQAESRIPDYDAVKDFSITSNPNGVWSYGWTASLGSPLNLYTVTDTDSVPGMSAWLVSGTYYGNPPYVAHNDTEQKICKEGWCVPPSWLHLQPGPGGELTVVRWTAPSDGKFSFRGAFQGLDRATTDVHVLVNSTKSLLSGPITSQKLPLRFQVRVKLLAGDTVDFVVGAGKKGDNAGDSTGIQFKVIRLKADDWALPVSEAAPSKDYPMSEYNALEDFSITSNPNGVWSYGWVASLGDSLNLYTEAMYCDPGFSEWRRYQGCYDDGALPVIAHNDTRKKICVSTVCVPPTYLVMHPGFNGELSILRWTAPSTGNFLLEGEFTGLDYVYPTTTDVHVLVNSTRSLLSGPITSYRLPLTFAMRVFLSSGDTLDFAVGFGYNRNFFGDSTGVRFAVKRLGP